MGSSNGLYPRGTFSNLFTNTTCPTPRHLTEVEDPFLGNMTFYHFNMIVSGACTLLTCLIIFHLKWQHALHFSVPTEQVKIMRIINMLPAFSVLSFISICWPNSYVYMEGWTEVFQALALYSFHMLLIDFLGPTERLRDEFFGNLRVKKAFKRGQYREGLSWLKLSYYSTLQYPFVVWICAIGQSIAQSFNVYCLDSNRPIFAHLWLEILQEVSVTIAINAIIRFYYNTRLYMKEHKPLLKLLSFKLIVGVIFLEKIIFLVLESSSVYHETNKLSYADVHMGIPTMVICIQMVPFAVFMHFAFSIEPYRVAKDVDIEMIPAADDKGRPIPRSYQGGRFGLSAWAAYLNPLEFWREIRSMSRTLSVHKVRNQKPIYQADIDAEKASKESVAPTGTESAQVAVPERAASTDSAGSSGHQVPYANSNYQQSQPLIPQAEFPLRPAQPAVAATQNEELHFEQHEYGRVSTYGQPDYDARYDGRS